MYKNGLIWGITKLASLLTVFLLISVIFTGVVQHNIAAAPTQMGTTTITENTVWDSTSHSEGIIIDGNLVISDNAKLTIDGIGVWMKCDEDDEHSISVLGTLELKNGAILAPSEVDSNDNEKYNRFKIVVNGIGTNDGGFMCSDSQILFSQIEITDPSISTSEAFPEEGEFFIRNSLIFTDRDYALQLTTLDSDYVLAYLQNTSFVSTRGTAFYGTGVVDFAAKMCLFTGFLSGVKLDTCADIYFKECRIDAAKYDVNIDGTTPSSVYGDNTVLVSGTVDIAPTTISTSKYYQRWDLNIRVGGLRSWLNSGDVEVEVLYTINDQNTQIYCESGDNSHVDGKFYDPIVIEKIWSYSSGETISTTLNDYTIKIWDQVSNTRTPIKIISDLEFTKSEYMFIKCDNPSYLRAVPELVIDTFEVQLSGIEQDYLVANTQYDIKIILDSENQASQNFDIVLYAGCNNDSQTPIAEWNDQTITANGQETKTFSWTPPIAEYTELILEVDPFEEISEENTDPNTVFLSIFVIDDEDTWSNITSAPGGTIMNEIYVVDSNIVIQGAVSIINSDILIKGSSRTITVPSGCSLTLTNSRLLSTDATTFYEFESYGVLDIDDSILIGMADSSNGRGGLQILEGSASIDKSYIGNTESGAPGIFIDGRDLGDDVTICECRIVDNAIGIYVSLDGGGDVFIEDNTLEGNSVGGVYLDTSYSTVEGNTLVENGEDSTTGYGISVNGGLPTIENNVLLKNKDYGIKVSSVASASMRLENNDISESKYGIFANNFKGVITENTIFENDYGVYIEGGEDASLTLCSIEENTVGVYLYGCDGVSLEDNHFAFSKEAGASTSAIVIEGLKSGSSSPIYIGDATSENEIAAGGTGIFARDTEVSVSNLFIDGSQIGVLSERSTIDITSSTFEECDYAIRSLGNRVAHDPENILAGNSEIDISNSHFIGNMINIEAQGEYGQYLVTPAPPVYDTYHYYSKITALDCDMAVRNIVVLDTPVEVTPQSTESYVHHKSTMHARVLSENDMVTPYSSINSLSFTYDEFTGSYDIPSSSQSLGSISSSTGFTSDFEIIEIINIEDGSKFIGHTYSSIANYKVFEGYSTFDGVSVYSNSNPSYGRASFILNGKNDYEWYGNPTLRNEDGQGEHIADYATPVELYIDFGTSGGTPETVEFFVFDFGNSFLGQGYEVEVFDHSESDWFSVLNVANDISDPNGDPLEFASIRNIAFDVGHQDVHAVRLVISNWTKNVDYSSPDGDSDMDSYEIYEADTKLFDVLRKEMGGGASDDAYWEIRDAVDEDYVLVIDPDHCPGTDSTFTIEDPDSNQDWDFHLDVSEETLTITDPGSSTHVLDLGDGETHLIFTYSSQDYTFVVPDENWEHWELYCGAIYVIDFIVRDTTIIGKAVKAYYDDTRITVVVQDDDTIEIRCETTIGTYRLSSRSVTDQFDDVPFVGQVVQGIETLLAEAIRTGRGEEKKREYLVRPQTIDITFKLEYDHNDQQVYTYSQSYTSGGGIVENLYIDIDQDDQYDFGACVVSSLQPNWGTGEEMDVFVGGGNGIDVYFWRIGYDDVTSLYNSAYEDNPYHYYSKLWVEYTYTTSPVGGDDETYYLTVGYEGFLIPVDATHGANIPGLSVCQTVKVPLGVVDNDDDGYNYIDFELDIKRIEKLRWDDNDGLDIISPWGGSFIKHSTTSFSSQTKEFYFSWIDNNVDASVHKTTALKSIELEENYLFSSPREVRNAHFLIETDDDAVTYKITRVPCTDETDYSEDSRYGAAYEPMETSQYASNAGSLDTVFWKMSSGEISGMQYLVRDWSNRDVGNPSTNFYVEIKEVLNTGEGETWVDESILDWKVAGETTKIALGLPKSNFGVKMINSIVLTWEERSNGQEIRMTTSYFELDEEGTATCALPAVYHMLCVSSLPGGHKQVDPEESNALQKQITPVIYMTTMNYRNPSVIQDATSMKSQISYYLENLQLITSDGGKSRLAIKSADDEEDYVQADGSTSAYSETMIYSTDSEDGSEYIRYGGEILSFMLPTVLYKDFFRVEEIPMTSDFSRFWVREAGGVSRNYVGRWDEGNGMTDLTTAITNVVGERTKITEYGREIYHRFKIRGSITYYSTAFGSGSHEAASDPLSTYDTGHWNIKGRKEIRGQLFNYDSWTWDVGAPDEEDSEQVEGERATFCYKFKIFTANGGNKWYVGAKFGHGGYYSLSRLLPPEEVASGYYDMARYDDRDISIVIIDDSDIVGPEWDRILHIQNQGSKNGYVASASAKSYDIEKPDNNLQAYSITLDAFGFIANLGITTLFAAAAAGATAATIAEAVALGLIAVALWSMVTVIFDLLKHYFGIEKLDEAQIQSGRLSEGSGILQLDPRIHKSDSLRMHAWFEVLE